MSSIDWNEEHLSAYLDGELDGDALDQVEQRLESDDEFRRCYEDFRALRESIQQLPRHKVEPDFSQRVLECIAAKATTRPATIQPAQASDRAKQPSMGRRWLPWALGAVAATLLFVLVIPGLLRGPMGVALNETGTGKRETRAATDDGNSVGKTSAGASSKMADTPAPFPQEFDTPARDEHAPKVPESARGAVLEEGLADEVREQDTMAATVPPTDEQPADLFLKSATANDDSVGDVAEELQQAHPQAGERGADRFFKLESTQPRPPVLWYREADSGSKELERLTEAQNEGATLATPSYLVSSPELSEQRLIEVLESRQLRLYDDGPAERDVDQERLAKKERAYEEQETVQSHLRLDDSSTVADLAAERPAGVDRQSLRRRVRGNYRFSGAVERKRDVAARYVVVDATIEKAADLLRALDPLVSAQGIELVPLAANARLKNGYLGIDSIPEEDRFSNDRKSLSPLSEPVGAATRAARTLGRGKVADSPAGRAPVVDATDEEVEPAAASVDSRQRRDLSKPRLEVRQSIDADQTAALSGTGGTSSERVRIVFAFDTLPSASAGRRPMSPAANAQRSDRDE